jgi:D-tyrosyl-tRNA(Tyr) deacylase
MRLVTQNVISAMLSVHDNQIASLGQGMVVFIGFTHEDHIKVVDKAIEKILTLRIFPDDQGKTNLTIQDIGGSILLVPNFTLYGDLSGSRRPSFTKAMKPDQAADLFQACIDTIRARYDKVQHGVFGANMTIHVVNQGPSTYIMDITL